MTVKELIAKLQSLQALDCPIVVNGVEARRVILGYDASGRVLVEIS